MGAWKALVRKAWLSDGGAAGRQLHCHSEDAQWSLGSASVLSHVL